MASDGLRGKVALIVASSSGPSVDVAAALSKELLKAGCTVRVAGQGVDLEFAVMSKVGVRDESKFLVHELDPEIRPGVVAGFVDDYWAQTGQALDLLFLVALHQEEDRVQADDYETCFALNCVSPLLFTHTMLPLLARSSPSAVVAVVGEHYKETALMDDPQFELQHYDPATAIGQSQSALLTYLAACERRFADRGVHFHGLNAGVVSGAIDVSTGATTTAAQVASVAMRLASGAIRPPAPGMLLETTGRTAPAVHPELQTGPEGIEAQDKFYAQMITDLGYLPDDPIEATEEEGDFFSFLACCGTGRD